MSKVWIDPDLLTNKSGIGRDSKFMIKWLEVNFETEIVKFHGLKFMENYFNRRILIAMRLIFGRSIRLSRKYEGAFYQSQLGPLLPGKNIDVWIVRLHDLFPITNPEWFRWWATKIFKSSLDIAIEQNAIFLCDSKSTHEELMKLYEGLKVNSLVVPCRLQEFISSKCSACGGCLKLQELKANTFYLSVGTVEPRKNYKFALSSWKSFLVDKPGIPFLVIVGRPGWKTKKLQSNLGNAESSRIIWLRDCCDGALEELYADCLALISFSLAEGFDFPPMEARQKFQKPLILSDIPVHREFHSDVALFFSDKSSLKQNLEVIPNCSYTSDYSSRVESSLKSLLELLRSILQKN
jgi:glycosyltransferase involved in cell wall biosynthesis